MGKGYESNLSDIIYLMSVASSSDRMRVAGLVHVLIAENNNGILQYFDLAGAEITIGEIHRRTQTDPAIQRSVYNMWMTYAH
jgi:hypothetical protein